MGASRTQRFDRLAAFSRIVWFLVVAIVIGCWPIEFVTVGERELFGFLFLVWVPHFLRVAVFVSCITFEGLVARVVLMILDMWFFSRDHFAWEFILVLWLTIKRHIFILVFNSWHYLLSHLRFVPRVAGLIRRIDIPIRLVRFRVYFSIYIIPSGLPFCQVLIGCLI